jgi:TetR/AcrR family transcriptional regulator, regulator of biofilm formation and stress response
VAAAREVITDNGYAQLSLRAVAERAGVGLSHLQYHFPTREKLVKALIGSVAADYAAATAAAIAAVPDTPTARFMATGRPSA